MTVPLLAKIPGSADLRGGPAVVIALSGICSIAAAFVNYFLNLGPRIDKFLNDVDEFTEARYSCENES